MGDQLSEEPFSYSVSKNGSVFIKFRGQAREEPFCPRRGHVVTTLGKGKAAKFLAEMETIGGTEAQLMMAKLTGNFKRGNERLVSKSSG